MASGGIDPRIFPGINLGFTALNVLRSALSVAGVSAAGVFGLVTEIPKLISRLVPPDPRSQFGAARAVPVGSNIGGLPSFGAISIESQLPGLGGSAQRQAQRLANITPETLLGFNVQSLFSIVPAQVQLGIEGVQRFLDMPLPTVPFRRGGIGNIAGSIAGAPLGLTATEFFQEASDVREMESRPGKVQAQIEAQSDILARDPIFQSLIDKTLLGQLPGAEISGLTAAIFPRPPPVAPPGFRLVPIGASTMPVVSTGIGRSGIQSGQLEAALGRLGGPPQGLQFAPGGINIRGQQFFQTTGAPPPGTPIPVGTGIQVGALMPEVSTSSGGLGAFGGFIEGLGGLVNAVSPIISPIIAANFPGQAPIAQPGGAPIFQVPGMGGFGGMQGTFQDPRLIQAQQAGFGQQFLDFTGIGGMLGIGGGNLPIQPVTSMTTRFPRTVSFTTQTPSGNPKVITYRNMGSCLLFSGDLSAAKRVRRIASKAKRRLGGAVGRRRKARASSRSPRRRSKKVTRHHHHHHRSSGRTAAQRRFAAAARRHGGKIPKGTRLK